MLSKTALKVDFLFCCVISLQENVFFRSSPGEARENQGGENERLGKRVRKKRKIYMDSGDEEEENQEEPEVRKVFYSYRAVFTTMLFH